MKESVGFIGLGTMGRHMARNIGKAGYEVHAYDIVPGRVREIEASGARPCGSVREVGERAGVVVTMLPSSPDVEEVVLGEGALIGSLRPGSTLIDMSTIDPMVTKRIAAALSKAGLQMLDAPVSRGEPAARDGTLVIMVGGRPAVFERWRPLLATMGTEIFYCGESGLGSAAKLVNNMMVGTIAGIIAEATVFGVKAGLTLEKILEVVGASSGNSWLLQNFFRKKAFAGDLAPGFKLALMHKDLGLALSAGASLGVPLMLTALSHQLYGLLKEEGLGDADFTGILALAERVAGVRARLGP
jgi:3-hydroxyisobutyrate dehydrogenase